jgi:hypothetical protein
MVCACIDIGTNTTRLLVAEADAGGLRELLAQRVFTRVRRAQAPDGTIAPAKLLELVDVVTAQVRAAQALGAVSIVAVATAAIRAARACAATTSTSSRTMPGAIVPSGAWARRTRVKTRWASTSRRPPGAASPTSRRVVFVPMSMQPKTM